jgi:CRP-like cAMP-binding protein
VSQLQIGRPIVELEKPRFDVSAFLASVGMGRRIIHFAPKEALFSQGYPADSVFHLQKGCAKVTVVSPSGKEATITLLSTGDFVGEEALTAPAGVRLASATAVTPCTTLKISRHEMIRVMHVEHSFSDLFLEVIME